MIFFFDKRMLEEINRTICDYCSDKLFVYYEEYKKNIFVVRNTIVEVADKFKNNIMNNKKKYDINRYSST
jgi:hypothetical protein